MIAGPVAFAYRAARHDGAIERGVITAAGRDGALGMLRDRGLFPLALDKHTETAARQRPMPARDLAAGLAALATLLEAGLTLPRALAALPEMTARRWRAMHEPLATAVREGRSLSAGLSAAPIAIPAAVLGIIQAGEQTGELASAIRRSAVLLEERAATRSALVQALVYPAILALAGAGSVALLVAVVIPRFADVLSELGQTLPATTRLVLDAAHVANALALPGMLATAMLLLLWRGWVATESGRERWHTALLALPLAGAVRHAAATSHASGVLSAMLATGVPLAPALQRSAPASGDAAVTARLLVARTAVVAGTRLSVALRDERAFSPPALRLVRAGEESGRLAEMLAHASRIEGERATQLVRGAVRVIEPGLVLLFGGVVALVAAALLQAVYAVRPV
jgi:general secretion pathway protein F